MEGTIPDNEGGVSGQATPDTLYMDILHRMEARLQQSEAGLSSTQAALQASLLNSQQLTELVQSLSTHRPGGEGIPSGRAQTATGPKHWKPPQWDGNSDSFVDYLERLRQSYRTRSELQPVLSDGLYWNEIYESIQDKEKRMRMRHYWTQGNESGLRDPEQFIAEINSVFGDSNEKGRALEQLINLKHEPGQPWRDHQRTFDGLLFAARGDLFPDDIKITHLKNTFSNTVRLNLVSMTKLADYHAFVAETDRIMTNFEETDQFKKYNRNWARKPESSRTDPSSATGYTGTSNRSLDREGDTAMTATRAPSNSAQQNNSGNRTSSQRRARWVDSAEQQNRREQGLCFRCGDSGHRIGKCPHLPAAKSNQVKVAAMGPVLEDDWNPTDSTNQPSGNEQLPQ